MRLKERAGRRSAVLSPSYSFAAEGGAGEAVRLYILWAPVAVVVGGGAASQGGSPVAEADTFLRMGD